MESIGFLFKEGALSANKRALILLQKKEANDKTVGPDRNQSLVNIQMLIWLLIWSCYTTFRAQVTISCPT